MAGLGIRLFTDEQIFSGLAQALRQRGYDAESCHEVGRANRGISDEDHLECATGGGRAILTLDSADFPSIDATWKRAGRTHAGIIMARPAEFGELLRRVERHLNTYPPEVQRDILLWLDTTPTR